MKIDSKIFNEYLKRVSLNTTILTIGLNFSDDGVETKVRNVMNTSMVIGKLKKEAFTDYEEIGEIFIKDVRRLVDVVKTFDGTITIEKPTNNFLRINNAIRKANIMLAEEKICDNIIRKDKPDIKTEISIEVSRNVLKRAVEDTKLLGISVVKFLKTGDKLTISVGTEKEYDYLQNFIKCDTEGDVSVGVASGFPEVVESISDNVLIHMGTNMPLIFEDKTEFIETEIFLSPFVDSGD